MLNPELKKYLEKLDQEPFPSFRSEFDIAKAIGDILAREANYKPTIKDEAERIAFNFFANPSEDNSIRKSFYYNPIWCDKLDKFGNRSDDPSIEEISQEKLEYWTKRARESKNPILSSHYADLVVDFLPRILDKKADNDLFQIVIDSNIAICEGLLVEPLGCKTKIKRALDLAILRNDQERILPVKDTIIKLEKDIAEDNNPGLWGFAFKWLLLEYSKKNILDEREKEELIDEMEKRLERVKGGRWPAENVVSLLAEYYAKEKDEKNLMRVLDVLENSLKEDKRMNSDPLLIQYAYEQMHEIYRNYENRFKKVREASERLSREIGQLDLDWEKSLKEIPIELNVKKKDIDNYLQGIFSKNKTNTLESVMTNIAMKHLHMKEVIEKDFKDTIDKNPLQFLGQTQFISSDGVSLATLSSLSDKNYEAYFQAYYSRSIQFDSLLLSSVMNELKKQFTKKEIIEYFEKVVVFKEENKEYLRRAISAYWDNDYLVASHLFIPIIESGVRNLIRMLGGAVLKLDAKLNGYECVSLGELLRDKKISDAFFPKEVHSVLFYFRLVLTEKLGMNLRNAFAHGLERKKFFNSSTSDRLFHILIWLSFIGEEEKGGKSGDETEAG